MSAPCPRRLLPLLAPALLAVLLLGGCNLLAKRTVVVWTNRPEMAAYVEYFNARQDFYRIELVYKELPARSWEEGGRPPDLLLDYWLNSPGRIGRLLPLEDLLRRKVVPRQAFYQELLARGALEGKQVLLPFCFQLPAAVFKASNLSGEVPNLALPLDAVRDQGRAFNHLQGSRFDRVGFSPRWNEEFLYLVTSLFGASFRQAGTAEITWNSAALREAIRYSQSWIREGNRGLEMDRQFADRYLYNPMDQLLAADRILFYMSTADRISALLHAGRDNLNFRWFAHKGKIAVQEDVLWAGIPRRARNVRGAKFFLQWLCQPQTHALILKINHSKRLKVFGICNGFSAFREVTESAFPQAYPWLIGHIPPEDMLQFPAVPPDRWAEVKRQVILPWLVGSLVQDQPEENLAAGIRKLYAGRSDAGSDTGSMEAD